MTLQPYLFFEGRCQEAIDFYKQSLGAEVLMQMRFQDCPEPQAMGGVPGDKIMHASLRIQDTVLMMSDGRCGGAPSFQGFALSLAPASDADAKRLFDALGEGGTVTMPLQKTFWASCFGMLTDRFGVNWMVNVEQPRT